MPPGGAVVAGVGPPGAARDVPGWHPQVESANRRLFPRLALRQPECQHDRVLRTPSGDTPSGDTPSGDTPSGDTPSGDTPSGDTPSGDAALAAATELADRDPLAAAAALRRQGFDPGLAAAALTQVALRRKAVA